MWRLQDMAGFLLAISVLLVLTTQSHGKSCEISRARIIPTSYLTKNCDGECCADGSYTFCCEVKDEPNIPVIIGFFISLGVLLIFVIFVVCCCYKYDEKGKVEEDDDDVIDDRHPESYGYAPRSIPSRHGYPPRVPSHGYPEGYPPRPPSHGYPEGYPSRPPSHGYPAKY